MEPPDGMEYLLPLQDSIQKLTKEEQKKLYQEAKVPLVLNIFFFVVFCGSCYYLLPMGSKEVIPFSQCLFAICFLIRLYSITGMMFVIHQVHDGSLETVQRAKRVAYTLKPSMIRGIFNSLVFCFIVYMAIDRRSILTLWLPFVPFIELIVDAAWYADDTVYESLCWILMNDEEREEELKKRQKAIIAFQSALKILGVTDKALDSEISSYGIDNEAW